MENVAISGEDVALILSLATLVGIVWRASNVINELKSSIDKVESRLGQTLLGNKSAIDIELTSLKDRDAHHDYLIHSLNEKIDHRTNRLLGEIQDIERYLERDHNFRIRNNDRPDN